MFASLEAPSIRLRISLASASSASTAAFSSGVRTRPVTAGAVAVAGVTTCASQARICVSISAWTASFFWRRSASSWTTLSVPAIPTRARPAEASTLPGCPSAMAMTSAAATRFGRIRRNDSTEATQADGAVMSAAAVRCSHGAILAKPVCCRFTLYEAWNPFVG